MVFSQKENEIWNETDTISTDNYEFQIPTVWQNLDYTLGGKKGPEQAFDATGQGLPKYYNGGPVLISAFLAKSDYSYLQEANKSKFKKYYSFTSEEYKLESDVVEQTFILKDNTKAVLIKTRRYLKSDRLNESRYDLITYSEKLEIAYVFSVTVRYFDDTYEFESIYDLNRYVEKLYATFKWK